MKVFYVIEVNDLFDTCYSTEKKDSGRPVKVQIIAYYIGQ